MRFDKFTIKSQELIQNAQSLASQLNNQQIEPEHLLAAMLDVNDGIAVAMLRKLGASPGEIAQEVKAAVDRFPKISGSASTEVYISPRSKAILEMAFSEATKMKDEYVSIEHILFAILYDPTGIDIIENCGGNVDSLITSLEDFFEDKIERIPDGNEYVLQRHFPDRGALDFQAVALQFLEYGRERFHGVRRDHA